MGKLQGRSHWQRLRRVAAAIRLQAAGFETVIFEKRDQAGGRAYVYRDHGFTFDAGPTVITAPECLRELLHGRQVYGGLRRVLPINPFYRLFWRMATSLITRPMLGSLRSNPAEVSRRP
jgi:phytoene dehydrogenase-like protein